MYKIILGVLLMTLLLACRSDYYKPITPVPDRPEYSVGEVIAIVQNHLSKIDSAHKQSCLFFVTKPKLILPPTPEGGKKTFGYWLEHLDAHQNPQYEPTPEWIASYLGGGEWMVVYGEYGWSYFERTKTVGAIQGSTSSTTRGC